MVFYENCYYSLNLMFHVFSVFFKTKRKSEQNVFFVFSFFIITKTFFKICNQPDSNTSYADCRFTQDSFSWNSKTWRHHTFSWKLQPHTITRKLQPNTFYRWWRRRLWNSINSVNSFRWQWWWWWVLPLSSNFWWWWRLTATCLKPTAPSNTY